MKKISVLLLTFLFVMNLTACQKEKEIEITYLKSNASEYTATLQRENQLFHDFNLDGEEDCHQHCEYTEGKYQPDG